MKTKTNQAGTLTAAGLFAALIVVLQLFATFVKFGPVSITLALAPIVIGGALYGRRFAAFLGAVLGIVILICGIFGLDGGAVMLMFEAAPLPLVLLCIGKTTVAGFVAAVFYKLMAAKGKPFAATVVAGILCPVVNTGLFILAMLTIWKDLLSSWAGGSNIFTYAILGLTGVNFLIELGVNLILATAITRIVRVLSHRRRS